MTPAFSINGEGPFPARVVATYNTHTHDLLMFYTAHVAETQYAQAPVELQAAGKPADVHAAVSASASLSDLDESLAQQANHLLQQIQAGLQHARTPSHAEPQPSDVQQQVNTAVHM